MKQIASGPYLPASSRGLFAGVKGASAIADILSAYDELMENNRRRIALLEEAARLLYREWFVHFRFPGHEHVKIIDGIPEGVGGRLPAFEAYVD